MRVAHWHNHVNGVRAPDSIRDWLIDPASLTAKLIAHSHAFRVQRVMQGVAGCWADEAALLGLVRPGKVHAREVLLNCNDIPAVFAHTVLPLSSTRGQWPLFGGLGNKSLGTTLFGDPRVRRGHLQFARLHPYHPAMQRARELLGTAPGGNEDAPLFARRSLFSRCGGTMLVTELFLPSISIL